MSDSDAEDDHIWKLISAYQLFFKKNVGREKWENQGHLVKAINTTTDGQGIQVFVQANVHDDNEDDSEDEDEDIEFHLMMDNCKGIKLDENKDIIYKDFDSNYKSKPRTFDALVKKWLNEKSKSKRKVANVRMTGRTLLSISLSIKLLLL